MESEGIGHRPESHSVVHCRGQRHRGFNDENYEAFQTSDTRNKAHKGGKGVGRFLWLKAFSNAEIESTYEHDGSFWKRTFAFTLSKSGVVGAHTESTDAKERKTLVTLVGFKPEFERMCPRSARVIARRIVEHCLQYFVLGTCPRILVHDKEAGDVVDVNRMFASEMKMK